MATLIKNGSEGWPNWFAMVTDIGPIITAVAALLMTSDRHIVATIKITRVPTRPNWIDWVAITVANIFVRPLSYSASPIGIIAPSNTITGHSIWR